MAGYFASKFGQVHLSRNQCYFHVVGYSGMQMTGDCLGFCLSISKHPTLTSSGGENQWLTLNGHGGPFYYFLK